MAPPYIIVSATNDYYLPLFVDLLRSLRACKTTFVFDIGLLDIGLSDANRQKLEASGVLVKTPGVDIDYPDREAWEKETPYFRAMTARPSLPDYFPGYKAYMWLDSDVWVQTPEALDVCLPAAERDNDIYIATEFDCEYPFAMRGDYIWDAWQKMYEACLPQQLACTMNMRPLLNVGVFALAAQAPHWRRWHDIMSVVLAQTPKMMKQHFVMEQSCLNYSLYNEGFGTKVMPADYNWMAGHQLPVFNEATGFFARPNLPHRALSIIHLSAHIKNTAQAIKTTGGRTLNQPLTYSAWQALRYSSEGRGL